MFNPKFYELALVATGIIIGCLLLISFGRV